MATAKQPAAAATMCQLEDPFWIAPNENPRQTLEVLPPPRPILLSGRLHRSRRFDVGPYQVPGGCQEAPLTSAREKGTPSLSAS